MAEPLRHRQTKEAATDMFYLTPPRHISTLPFASILTRLQHVRLSGNLGSTGCPILPVEGIWFGRNASDQTEPRIMRYELRDFERGCHQVVRAREAADVSNGSDDEARSAPRRPGLVTATAHSFGTKCECLSPAAAEEL